MSAESPIVLTVPGYNNAGPQHWLTLWERHHPRVVRVEQDDWDHPRRDAWTARLAGTLDALAGPVLLAAHSLGCLTIAHWAAEQAAAAATRGSKAGGTAALRPDRIAGALLVAPADVEREETPADLRDFAPIPLLPLPFPAVVVASRNDPWADAARSREFAAAWGARYVDAGAAGHLDSASGLHDWPDGWTLLHDLAPRS